VQTLLAFAVIGFVMAFYLATPVLLGRAELGSTTEYKYPNQTSAPSSVNVRIVLSLLGQSLDPADVNRLSNMLKGVGGLPVDNDDVLGRYIKTMANFTDSLVRIDSGLQSARAEIASGRLDLAAAELGRLNGLTSESRRLLRSLYSLLDRVGRIYGIDTSNQLVKIQSLDSLLQYYSTEIDYLGSALNPAQGTIQTVLITNASKREVLVSENVLVYGILEMQNNTLIAGRNVTVSWGQYETTLTTDSTGKFAANVSFPIGSPSGLTPVRVAYRPEGIDLDIFLPSSSTVEIQVLYESSYLKADISPKTVKPLDTIFLTGNLSTVAGRPLENRTLILALDGDGLGSTVTGLNGSFRSDFSVPGNLANGTHTVSVIFQASNDFVQSANATLPFTLVRVASETRLSLGDRFAVSGMGLTVSGTVSYENNGSPLEFPNPSGIARIYIDGVPHGYVSVKDNGIFASVIQLPVGLSFGSHSIMVQYEPEAPWVEGSRAQTQIYVFNTPLMMASVGIVVIVAFVYVAIRKRSTARAILEVSEEPLEERGAEVKFSESNLLAKVGAQEDNRSKIRMAFNAAREIIKHGVGEEPQEHETASEYLSRISKVVPSLMTSLTCLVELFELAEYSPLEIDRKHAQHAERLLLELRDQVERVK